MKKIIVSIWLLALSTIIAVLFWYNDLVYQIPTPVPQNYSVVQIGTFINIPTIGKRKPVFIHFFNPNCPCSRFNIPSVKLLYHKYHHQFNFMIVVVGNGTYTADEINNKFNIDATIVFDKSIAIKCGVYATPQLVLLNSQHRLFYRGNYNRNRYCADEKTNYAKFAIEGLLGNNKLLLNRSALKPYGCQFIQCIK
jgi:hypothetical protein